MAHVSAVSRRRSIPPLQLMHPNTFGGRQRAARQSRSGTSLHGWLSRGSTPSLRAFYARSADVIEAGFEVVPTFRSPHVTITFYDDVDDGVARLLAVIVPGRLIVVGAGSAIAIAEVVDVAGDGLVHVRPLPGPVTEQRLKSASLRV